MSVNLIAMQFADKRQKYAEKMIVVGGGIAGVCCAQELARLAPDKKIVLITASKTLIEVQFDLP